MSTIIVNALEKGNFTFDGTAPTPFNVTFFGTEAQCKQVLADKEKGAQKEFQTIVTFLHAVQDV